MKITCAFPLYSFRKKMMAFAIMFAFFLTQYFAFMSIAWAYGEAPTYRKARVMEESNARRQVHVIKSAQHRNDVQEISQNQEIADASQQPVESNDPRLALFPDHPTK